MIKKMDNVNLHIYPSNSFSHESRMQKETKSMADYNLFDKIFIAVLSEKGFKEYEELDDKREVWRVPLKTAILKENTFCKIIKHIEWMLKIFFRFKNKPIKCVNCHNLSSLPIGMLFKMFLKSKVVYDTHELETERPWSNIRKAMAKMLEKSLIHRVDVVITTTNSIAQWYRDKYSLKNVYTIYNFPYKRVENEASYSNILKEKFNIKDDEILFIYQGALGKGRSIELFLDIFSGIKKKNRHIVFMGFGPFEDKIKEYSKNFSNIHFQPAVKPEDIIDYTKSADIGLCLTGGVHRTCLNYYLALANKVLEYIVAGLPVIANDFPEPKKIISRCECGWTVPVDRKVVADLIENIPIGDIKEKGKNAIKHRDIFAWENEAKKLLEIYEELCKK